MKEEITLPTSVPKGIIKIELFDASTDEKLEEVNTHNFISIGTREFYFKLAIASLFTRLKASTPIDYAKDQIVDPFRVMSLTTASHPEDPDNEVLVLGNEIGYALTNATYSGTDKLRGTYNQVESSTSLDRVRIVVDFPTHACNGTFQSIYFREEAPKNYIFAPYNVLPFGSTVLRVMEFGDKIYVLDFTSAGYSRNLRVFDKDLNQLQSGVITSNTYDFTAYGDAIYSIGNTGIYRSPLSSIFTHTRLLTATNIAHPVTGANQVQVLTGIAFDSQTNTFKVFATYTDTTLFSLIEYSTSFVKISQREFLTSNVSTPFAALSPLQSKLDFYQGNLLLHTATDTYTLDWETGDIARTYIGVCLGFVKGHYINSASQANPMFGFSSRSLLPSPFTKTATQTMKITYDFVLPTVLGGGGIV